MSALLTTLSEQPVVTRLGLTLLHFLWQGTLLALAAVAARRVLHAAAAPARRRTAILLLAAAPLFPLITFFVLPEGARITRHAPAPVAAARPVVPAVGADSAPVLREPASPAGLAGDSLKKVAAGDAPGVPGPHAGETAAVSKTEPDAAVSSPLADAPVLLPWLVLCWAAGVAAMALRHTGGWWVMRRWRRETSPLPAEWERRLAALGDRLGLPRAARAVVSTCGRGPALAGILRPVILIPLSAFTVMSPAQLEAVLLHELAHLKRRDHLVTALLIFTGTLLFYHPAIWLLSAWVREEREHAADELAAQACGDRADYVRALAALAGFSAVPSGALAADGGNVASRIRRVLGRREPEPGLLRDGLLPALAAVAGALCLTLPSTAQTPNKAAAPTADKAGDAGKTEASALPVKWVYILRDGARGYLNEGGEFTPLPGYQGAVTAANPIVGRVAWWSDAAGAGAETVVTPANGQPLQARIDAAAEGATIRLGEGVFEGNLVVTKPVTLEGSGEGVTTLKGKAKEAPVITLRGVKGVVIRGLKVEAAPVQTDGNTLASAGAVELEDSEFTFEKCSITGPAHNGIVLKASSAAVRDSLISGMWSNGITVGRGSHDVTIERTDVRNCYYTPIVIGRQTERVTIDRCRVSGGAWHGIRYDDTSPVITNCLIFRNARLGIYASGKTNAVVRGNVFLENEMGGMACWFANEDTVEGNTFRGNLTGGISVLGGSKTIIRRNIFSDSPAAITVGKIAEEGKDAKAEGAPVMEGNLFWKVEKEFARGVMGEALADHTKSLREDPGFVNAAAGDLRLTEASPARKRGIGAQEPLGEAGTRALTEGEKSIIPDGKSRSYELWKTAGYQKKKDEQTEQKLREEANAKAEAWRGEALQIDSVERRDAAIAAIRAAVESDDPQTALPGLMALTRSVAADFDKAPFRAPARKWMISGNAPLRNAALGAIHSLGAEAADLDALYTLAENRDTPDRGALVTYLHFIGKGDLTGRGGKVVTELLESEDTKLQQDALDSIWGARFSRELEERVIALSRTGDSQRDHIAVYFALSPQANKSARSIDRLMEIMGGETGGDPQRASWGLGQGVSKAEAPHLARLAVKVFGDNVSPDIRGYCLSLIKQYGSREELPFLDQTASRPAVTSTIRKAVEEAKAAIAERKGENGESLAEWNK